MRQHHFHQGPSGHKNGFTLIEILLAIGILAILATATIIAINPAQQFAQARNAQRWSDIDAIANAVYQYSVRNKGNLPTGMPIGSEGEICQSPTEGNPSPQCVGGAADMADLYEGDYLTAMPIDPSCPDACATDGTGYNIGTNENGRVIVEAYNAELGDTIKIVK